MESNGVKQFQISVHLLFLRALEVQNWPLELPMPVNQKNQISREFDVFSNLNLKKIKEVHRI
jgi:hypothetical protein